MTDTITSRVAIQARIAEWQRQYHTSDYGPTDLLFGTPKSRAHPSDLVPARLIAAAQRKR